MLVSQACSIKKIGCICLLCSGAEITYICMYNIIPLVFYVGSIQATFIIRSSDYKQRLQVEVRKAKIQQICMNFSISGLDLKSLFMVTGAYYESGL